MISDDERREVARTALLYAEEEAQFWKRNVADAMGLTGRESDAAMWHRLADLIDPGKGIESDAYKPVDFDGFAVDRDALLALERDVRLMGDDVGGIAGCVMHRIARRIREALGVER